MTVRLEEIVYSYTAQTSDFERGQKRIQDALKGTERQATVTGSTLSSKLGGALGGEFKGLVSNLTATTGGFGRMASALGPVGVGLGAVAGLTLAAGASFIKVTRDGVGLGSMLHDVSVQSGLTVETLSGLQSSLKESGTDIGALSNAAFFLHKNLGAAAGGSREMQAALRAVDIKNFDDALGDTDATLRTVFKSLGEMTTAGERDAKGAAVLGRAYKELRVFIAETGGDIDETLRRARESGEMMSAEVAGNLDALGDAYGRLDHKAQVMGANFIGIVAPEITKGLDDISTALSANVTSVEAWGQAYGFWFARVRGQMEGAAKWWHGDTWSPQKFGEAIGQGADNAELGMMTDWLWNKIKPPQPKGGGGGGGFGGGRSGGGHKAKDLSGLHDQLRDAEYARRLGGVGFDVTKYKAGLDAEQSTLEASLRSQLVSVKDYWIDRERLALAGMDAEIRRLNTEKRLAGEAYKEKFGQIGHDEKDPASRTLKQQIESAKWANKNYELEGQLAEATERRAAAAKTFTFESAEAARQLAATMAGLKADFLESSGNTVGAAYLRTAEQFKELRGLATANAAAFPDATKWIAGLERAAKLSANLARLSGRFDISKGYLGLETAGIQDKVADGILRQRDGLRQVYDLEVKYRDALRGTLGEMLAIAQARGDDAAVLNIKEQIRETERLGHVINETRAQARGIFSDAFMSGLDELDNGLKAAASTFGLELLESVRHAMAQNLTDEIGRALFGKNDQFGSDPGLFGKGLKAIGLGGFLNDPATTAAQVANTQALALQTTAETVGAQAIGFNTTALSVNTAALHELAAAMQFSGLAGESDGGGGWLDAIFGIAQSAVGGGFGGGGGISGGTGFTIPGGGGGIHEAGHFAKGGSFMVGGSGATDKTFVPLWATKGERVTVETPGQQRAGGMVVHQHITFHVTAPGGNIPRETQSQIARRSAKALEVAQRSY